MQHIMSGYRGMTVLMTLNLDRMLFLATLALALWAGAFIGSF
ncbi:MAG: hypothetical protein NXH74_04405 [Rhodobacteraceae bacterium]|nr:hypothetical protein [Paracoccaceae bacterium]